MPLLFLAIAVGCGLAAFDAYAQAASMDRGPFDPSLLATYGWMIGISLLGGIASFYQKVKRGQARWFNLGELFGELLTSALAGLLTFWLCKDAKVSEYTTAALVGIGGHMGSRALFLLERLLEKWMARFFPSVVHQLGDAEARRP